MTVLHCAYILHKLRGPISGAIIIASLTLLIKLQLELNRRIKQGEIVFSLE